MITAPGVISLFSQARCLCFVLSLSHPLLKKPTQSFVRAPLIGVQGPPPRPSSPEFKKRNFAPPSRVCTLSWYTPFPQPLHTRGLPLLCPPPPPVSRSETLQISFSQPTEITKFPVHQVCWDIRCSQPHLGFSSPFLFFFCFSFSFRFFPASSSILFRRTRTTRLEGLHFILAHFLRQIFTPARPPSSPLNGTTNTFPLPSISFFFLILVSPDPLILKIEVPPLEARTSRSPPLLFPLPSISPAPCETVNLFSPPTSELWTCGAPTVKQFLAPEVSPLL